MQFIFFRHGAHGGKRLKSDAEADRMDAGDLLAGWIRHITKKDPYWKAQRELKFKIKRKK